MIANRSSAVFQVSDLSASIAFYTDSLGFDKEFVFGSPPFYASVTKGEALSIHLNSGKENERRLGLGSVYVYCDEVDDYYAAVIEKGVTITSILETWPYGMRDFQLSDPDGNLLCFGCFATPEEGSGP